MSNIIRLQNLPQSAKSDDIRKFFGNLRIPDGSINILGGKEGDAFIAFSSHEDAHNAMRKDNERIKYSHIKLYLSSQIEMQHEIEKIAKGCISELFSQDPFSQNRASPDISKCSSSDRRRYYDRQSPHRYGKWSDNTQRKLNKNFQRSRSPIHYDSKYRSHSPSRRSRSFLLSQSPARSPKTRSTSNYFDKMRSVSSKFPNYMHCLNEQNTEEERETFPYMKQNEEISSPTGEIQAELKGCITESIEKIAAVMYGGGIQHIPGLDMTHDPRLQGGREPFFEQNIPRGIVHHDMHLSLPFIGNNFEQFLHPEFKHYILDNNQQHGISPIITHCDMVRSYGSNEGQRKSNRFYITMSGLDPCGSFREVQIVLNGIYAPENNIRFEFDKAGYKTGTAFIRLINKNDFQNVLNRATILFSGRRITISECPEFICREYFNDSTLQSEYVQQKKAHNFQSCSKNPFEKIFPSSGRPLSVVVTGLPLFTSCEALLVFFENSGFKPTAIHITLQRINGKLKCDGRAFIEFNNFQDFDLALKLHGNSFKSNIICVKQTLYDEMLKILNIHKAKHYFETSEPIIPALNVPEKVPYLWEPPDETESEKDKLNVTNNSWSNNHESNVIQKDFKPVILPNVVNRMDINAIPAINTFHKKNFSPRQLIHIKTETEKEIKAKNVDKYVHRKPVKFNVNKQIIKKQPNCTKTADSFDPTIIVEEKLKLSKLSPGKESHPTSVKKYLKCLSSKTKNTNFRHKSPEKKKNVIERNFYKGRKDKKGDKYCLALKSVSRFGSFSKKHFERESRRGYERRSDFRRNPPNLMHSEKDLCVEDRSLECVVQLSNVSPSVKNYEFIEFLKGFSYYKDSFIRRYTNETPANDVRVTFINRPEAELAVKTLTGRRWKGVRINMFII